MCRARDKSFGMIHVVMQAAGFFASARAERTISSAHSIRLRNSINLGSTEKDQ